jgi:hypothetical protein
MTSPAWFRLMSIAALAGVWSCNSSSGTNGDGGAGGSGHGASGGSSSTGGAGGGAGNAGQGGSANGGTGGAQAGGGGGSGDAGNNGAGGTVTGSGGAGVTTCTPGKQETLITDCGYPFASSTPLTSVTFNESEVLRAIQASGGWPTATVQLFYNDEHALTLGIRQVVATTATGPMTTDFPMSMLTANPGTANDPQTGTNEIVGPHSGLDVSQRPMWPVLYITDISADPKDRSGDWQFGGRPHGPNQIFGSWKGAVRTVDATVTPNKITITPDKDPMKNNWNLGGGDPVPAGLRNEGFGAEVRWNVSLTPGHSYRLQVMVHDGDQNKAGGDSGEACVVFCAGGSAPPPGDAGVPPPPATCPMGTTACGAEGSPNAAACPTTTVCANGCCVPLIP